MYKMCPNESKTVYTLNGKFVGIGIINGIGFVVPIKYLLNVFCLFEYHWLFEH